MKSLINPKYKIGDIVIGNSPKKAEWSESRVYMGTISYATYENGWKTYENGWKYNLATIDGTWLCEVPEDGIITIISAK